MAGAMLIAAILMTYPSSLGRPKASLPSWGQSAVIVVPAAWRDDGAVSLAAGDLSSALASIYGISSVILTDESFTSLPSYAFLLGNRNNRWIQTLEGANAISLPDLGQEGYFIERLVYSNYVAVVIAGGGELGTAYGAFRFIEKARLDNGVLNQGFREQAEPQLTFRLVSNPTGPAYPSPEQALRWGFNAVAIEAWPGLVLYDGLDPAIYDARKYPTQRAWVEDNRRLAGEQIAAAKRLHLKVVSSGDVPSFPQQVFTLYRGEITDGGRSPRICTEKEKTRQLLAYAVDEVLTDFPQIDALMVRTGENYPAGPLTGNTLQEEGDCNSSSVDGYALRLGNLMDLLASRIVDAHGKVYIQRAWDLGADGFHASPQVSASVTTGVTARPDIILSFKGTQTDFWRYNRVNANIGQGGFAQMVEFQAAREYEGKGAFPNFLGEVYARGGPETSPRGGVAYAYNRGVRWIWVWAKGGGWGGPEPATDLWNSANVYALSRLAWTVSADPQAIARDWAVLHFGPRSAPYIVTLLNKSAEVVLKAFYVGAYAKANGEWAPNNLWLRDDVIFGGDRLVHLYRASRDRGSFMAAFREKEEAAALVEEMLREYRRAMPYISDPRLAEEGLNTLLYEKALVDALRHYFTGMFYFYRWEDGGKSDASARYGALQHLGQWQESWRYYKEEVVHLPWVATPFYDRGMGAAVADALKELGE